MKRYADLSPEEQQKAVIYQLNNMDQELVQANTVQATTIANRRARGVFYSEQTDVIIPLATLTFL